MSVQILTGDCREMLATLADESVQCCVTSPPYFGLRDYGVAGQIGLEQTPDAYVAELAAVFREVRRVLRSDGTVWLNLGDSFSSSTKGTGGGGNSSGLMRDGRSESGRASKAAAVGRQLHNPTKIDLAASGLKPKDLIGIPWRVAFALQSDGWWLRSDIVWSKPNPMPESVTDRPTKAHEYVFLLSKAERYFFDQEAVAERAALTGGGTIPTPDKAARAGITSNGTGATSLRSKTIETRNIRSVWTIATEPSPEAHFAMMPTALAERCIKAGCPTGGTVLDPFAGAGTTLLVADRLGRDAIGIELSPDNAAIAERRIARDRLVRGNGTMADVEAARLPATPLEALLTGALT